jgi:hypothetical protein
LPTVGAFEHEAWTGELVPADVTIRDNLTGVEAVRR